MEVLETVLRTEQREHQKPVRLLLGGNRSRGRGTTGIALVLGGGLPQSSMTVRRYTKGAIAGLLNHTTNKPGTQPISEATKHELCVLVGNPPPPNATQWRVREIAKRTGVGTTTVSAILSAVTGP